MTRSKRISVFCLGFILLSAGNPSHAQWQNQISGYSDYIYRGLTYVDQPAALSWLSEYRFQSGVFVGFWASAHNDDTTFRGQQEFDLWLGFAQPLSETIAIEYSFTEFSYPEDVNNDYDWRELSINLHIEQRWSFSAGLNQDRFGDGDEGFNLEATHRIPWRGNLIDLTGGYGQSDDFGAPAVTVGTTDDDGYFYYEIGISRAFQSLDQLRARIALVGTNQSDVLVYGQKLVDSEWMFSLHYNF